MARKDSKFVSVTLPKYLARDIDNFMIKTKREGSRAAFIVGVVDRFLDEMIWSEEEERNRVLHSKDLKVKPLSARARRHDILITLDNIPDEAGKELLEEYKRLSKEIEKG